MTSDPFDLLDERLREVVRRQALDPSERRPASVRGARRRTLVGLAGVLALLAAAAAALAATGLLSAGTPLMPPTGTPLDPHAGFGIPRVGSVVLPVAVPDPGGGPPWGLRYVTTTRGLGCLQAGRLVRGQIGVIGQDSAFADDGRFHRLAADYLYGAFPCGTLDAHGHAFAGVAVTGAPASGLIGPTQAERGCERLPSSAAHVPAVPGYHRPTLPACPAQDERYVYYGMAGPQAVSVTYVNHGQLRSVATVGGLGAYLIVLPAPARGQQQFSPLPGAGGGPIRSIAFRNGYVCRLPVPTWTGGARTCPHVGQVPLAPAPAPADVSSPVTASIARKATGHTLVVSFIARLPVTSASSQYTVRVVFPGRAPNCGNTIIGPLVSNVARGQRERFTQSTNGCHGTFRGTVSYDYGLSGVVPSFGTAGNSVTVGTFTVSDP
jgi:hypothetical protein